MPRDARAASATLVPLRTSGNKPPLLVVHGLLCDPGFANLLSRTMPEDQPVYTFAAVGMDGQRRPLRSVEAVADEYVGAAESVVEEGAFQIAGYCAGSLIAMEMAHQFTRQGRAPEHLLIVDYVRIASAARWMAYKREQLAALEKLISSNAHVKRKWPGWQETVSAIIDAAAAYEVRPYQGPTSVVVNEEALPLLSTLERGWKDFLPAISKIVGAGASRQDLLSTGMSKIVELLERRR